MSLVIWKTALAITDTQSVVMPEGAKPLAAQIQLQGLGGPLSLWFLCDPLKPKVARTIAIYDTGHAVPDDAGEYIDTFQISNGALVFHVFANPVAAPVR